MALVQYPVFTPFSFGTGGDDRANSCANYMGKQIQINLSREAEDNLRNFLTDRFPHCNVVDSVYPFDWDRQTLSRSRDASKWLITDDRTTAILCESSNQCVDDGGSSVWQIRSCAYSCIEWSRDLYGTGQIPSRGRLYINTNPDPIWMDVSAETGDDIEKMYNAACRWIRKHGEKDATYRIAVWVVT
jgi:hypothetical protein